MVILISTEISITNFTIMIIPEWKEEKDCILYFKLIIMISSLRLRINITVLTEIVLPVVGTLVNIVNFLWWGGVVSGILYFYLSMRSVNYLLFFLNFPLRRVVWRSLYLDSIRFVSNGLPSNKRSSYVSLRCLIRN